MPPIVPIAKENQNTSSGPSKRNGMRPRMVDMIVSMVGFILWLYDLTYSHMMQVFTDLSYGFPDRCRRRFMFAERMLWNWFIM